MYGIITYLRNKLFDCGIIEQKSHSVKIISVGNIRVGGTGKTPFVEYLIKALSPYFNLAILSRGYGRKTSGFRLARATDTARTIGDEPMLIHTLFPELPLAVCANRVEGIKRLLKLYPKIQCVILDDAYQHRSLRCGMYILLTPYNRLYVHDHMLPWGRLRDVPSQSIRANVVVVTKCPEHMQPIDRRVVANALQLPSYQQLVFSHITYQPLSLPGTPLLVTGIANPQPMLAYLREQYPNTELLAFPDHHIFTNNDLEIIRAKAENYICVVTTEKDYMRLQHTALVKQLGNKLYVQTIKTDFGIDTEAFDRAIRLYISENNRNSKH